MPRRAGRLAGGIPRGAFEGAPDLTVEVLSPTNRAGEMGRKIVDYLTHGVREVWVVDPEARTIIVHQPGAVPRLLRGGDVLDGGDVIPGFSVPLAFLVAGLAPPR